MMTCVYVCSCTSIVFSNLSFMLLNAKYCFCIFVFLFENSAFKYLYITVYYLFIFYYFVCIMQVGKCMCVCVCICVTVSEKRFCLFAARVICYRDCITDCKLYFKFRVLLINTYLFIINYFLFVVYYFLKKKILI